MSASAFDLSKSPFEHFELLFKNASDKVTKDVNAMALATCDRHGVPSVRTVLYKGIVREGFSFYTNYESQKSAELLANPKASVLFFWPILDQQIRIEGIVEKLSREESEKYFRVRPRLSQIGAWASKQSQTIPNFQYLQDRVAELEKEFAGKDVPCPPHWGGFHLLPLKFEFWFGHNGRLHERYVFERNAISANWKTSLKSP